MLLHMLAPQHLKKVDLVCRDRCFEGNDWGNQKDWYTFDG
jgi:hypothetical protein